jgi:hypothetical protein
MKDVESVVKQTARYQLRAACLYLILVMALLSVVLLSVKSVS